MAPLSDDELVVAAQGGDRNALDQLLRRHYDRIYAVCRRVTGGTKDADDACQEALIKITRSLPRFDGRAAFSTWAYRIATNASLDELRKRKRRPSLHSINPHSDGSDGAEPEIVDPMAAKRIDAIDDRLAIDEALGELSDDFKAAVVLRDVADLDYDEIADVLDIPVGTVKSRIARGRAALAVTLRLGDLLDDPRTRPAGEHNDVMNVADPVTEEIRIIGNQADEQERPTDST
ncbi:MAG: RNA polymerase sigma-70 factor (ECF subfamily) [Ilumatobacter sp.]|jgi:RNA polymerase sigma-70 factor (ECF subfamily)